MQIRFDGYLELEVTSQLQRRAVSFAVEMRKVLK